MRTTFIPPVKARSNKDT